MKHRHQSVAVNLTHVPGSGMPTDFKLHGDADDRDRILRLIEDRTYGYTIITYRCPCGEIWTTKQVGEAVLPEAMRP